MEKRRRTANFTAEEKLRFGRLLHDQGQCIISKVTSHDAASNKEKELTWTKITKVHNSGGNHMRTTDTLKKLWTKLKSEAKMSKAACRQSVSGTGGGPSKNFEDPVLELVAVLTGRATTGILNVQDCDAVIVPDEDMTENECQAHVLPPPVEYLDEDILNEEFQQDNIMIIEENEKITQAAGTMNQPLSKNIRANRRRPDLAAPNERSDKSNNQKKVNNRFAAERLRAEQEKTNLIVMQIKHNAELHNLKMENEKLKKDILETILKKVSGNQILHFNQRKSFG